jgi:hypothetical protein
MLQFPFLILSLSEGFQREEKTFYLTKSYTLCPREGGKVMVFNATFNNISAIS